jgi:hypothetical protein
MSNERLLTALSNALSSHSFNVLRPSTGSIYMVFECAKVKQIRISNHTGRKPKRDCWELRTDVSTTRSGSNRIYSVGSISQLIKDFK